MTREALSPLVGERLWLKWRDDRYDWPWYCLLGIREVGPLFPPMLWLQGEDAPDATETWGRYEGGHVEVPADEVAEVRSRDRGPEVWW